MEDLKNLQVTENEAIKVVNVLDELLDSYELISIDHDNNSDEGVNIELYSVSISSDEDIESIESDERIDYVEQCDNGWIVSIYKDKI